jgi:hypothetical protein
MSNATYQCRRYLQTAQRGLVFSLGLLLIMCWFLPVVSLATHGAISSFPATLAAYASFAAGCVLLLAMLFSRQMKQMRLEVTDTALIRHGGAVPVIVEFSKATAFRYRKIPFLLGSGELRSDTASIRIPFIVEDLPLLINDIKLGLERAGAPAGVLERGVDRMFREATLSELSTARLSRYIGAAQRGAVWCFFGAMSAARLFWEWPMFLALGLSLAAMVVPVCGLVVADAVLSRRTRRALARGDAGRDVREISVVVWCSAMALTAFLLAGVILQQLLAPIMR